MAARGESAGTTSGAAEQAESELRRLGLEDVRVCDHGDLARVRVPSDDIGTVSQEPLREAVRDAVRSAGFRHVAVDLDGIEPGAFANPLVSRRRSPA